MSISSITKNGYTVIFKENSAVVKRKNDSIVLTAKRKNDLYITKFSSEHQGMITVQNDQFMRWHQRLGHLNFKDIRKLHDKNMITGMKVSEQDMKNEPRCEICDLSKISIAV